MHIQYVAYALQHQFLGAIEAVQEKAYDYLGLLGSCHSHEVSKIRSNLGMRYHY